MLDSPEGVCAGQAGFEYPATSVPFSISISAAQSPIWWAWLDLNQRPHPYQRSTAKAVLSGIPPGRASP